MPLTHKSQPIAIPKTREDRLIRVMAPVEQPRGFRALTFSENEVEAVAEGGPGHSALVLRSGVEIPVALSYEGLEQKIYRPDFRSENESILDLRASTGPSARPPSALQPGDVMTDGTVYAGPSPETGRPLFVIPDERRRAMTYNEAGSYADACVTHGHKDWRLPTGTELSVLFNNRAAVGGFHPDGGWYWSGDENEGTARQEHFAGGAQGFYSKNETVFVRCVRSDPAP